MLERMMQNRRGLGLLIMRIIVGVIAFTHGYHKFFYTGIGDVAESYAVIGIYYPTVVAWIIALGEFIGGILLIVGFFTREAALFQALVMVGAILAVHGSNGFFMVNSGYEYNLALIGSYLCLLFSGGGGASLDAIFFPRERWHFISDPSSIKLDPPSDIVL